MFASKSMERLTELPLLMRHFFWDRPRLETGLFDQLRYSPLLVQMVLTRRCNLTCGYCNEYDRSSDPLPLSQIKAQLDRLRELGTLAVEFTGGEPLLHPDFFAILAYATQLGFPARMMISNAFLFTPEKIDRLNRAGLTHLQVSVDGVKPNQITVKVLNKLRPKLEMLAAGKKFIVQLSAVIGSCSVAELLEIIAFAHQADFLPRVLLLHDEKGRLNLSADELSAYEQTKQAIGKRFSEAHGYREKLLAGQPAPFKCRAGARYLYVDEFGMVSWCSQQRQDFAKPLLTYRAADLREQFHVVKDCNRYCTIGCVRTASALDEWRP